MGLARAQLTVEQATSLHASPVGLIQVNALVNLFNLPMAMNAGGFDANPQFSLYLRRRPSELPNGHVGS